MLRTYILIDVVLAGDRFHPKHPFCPSFPGSLEYFRRYFRRTGLPFSVTISTSIFDNYQLKFPRLLNNTLEFRSWKCINWGFMHQEYLWCILSAYDASVVTRRVLVGSALDFPWMPLEPFTPRFHEKHSRMLAEATNESTRCLFHSEQQPKPRLHPVCLPFPLSVAIKLQFIAISLPWMAIRGHWWYIWLFFIAISGHFIAIKGNQWLLNGHELSFNGQLHGHQMTIK